MSNTSALAVVATTARAIAMGSPTKTPWLGNVAFIEHAEPLPARVLLDTTGFRNAALRGPNANGNFGFSYSGKHDVQLPNGPRVYCQVTLNVTGCKGSMPKGDIGHALDLLTLFPRTSSVDDKGTPKSAGWYASGKADVAARSSGPRWLSRSYPSPCTQPYTA